MDLDERFNNEDLEWLRKPDEFVETSFIERKAAFDPPNIARQISAFANSRHGGLVVVGVASDGTIPGLSSGEVDNKLQTLRQSVETVPRWRWDLKSVAVPQQAGQVVLLIRVPHSAYRVVMTSARKAYRRIGNKTEELTSEQVAELQQNTGERPFEDVALLPFSEDILDADLCAAFQAKLAERQTLENSLIVDLRNQHLVVEKDGESYLTVAAVLSLGRDPASVVSGARVRVTRFAGTVERYGSERNATKDQFFDGPLPRMVFAVRQFVQTQLREFDFLGPQGLFVKVPEYPPAVWDEAIVNAIVHRSYSLSSTVEVRLFDDRMEVTSPGGFPGTVSEQNLTSQPRNRHLAEALQHFELVRLAREGTRRMVSEMASAGLPPPRFKESPYRDTVTVTLFNEIDRRIAAGKRDPNEEDWRSIEADISDRLPILRAKALERWRALVQQGKATPRWVVEASLRLLADGSNANERKPVVEMISDVRNVPDDMSWEVVGRFLNSQAWAEDKAAASAAVRLAYRSEYVVERVLSWFETRWEVDTPTKPALAQVEFAVSILLQFLLIERKPKRDQIVRVLKASQQYRADVVKDLTALINGETR